MTYHVSTSAIPLLFDPPFLAGMLLIATAFGYRALRILRAPLGEVTRVERGVLSAAVGLGLLQFLPFGLAVAGILSPAGVWVGLATLTVVLSRDVVRVLRSASGAVRRAASVKPNGFVLLCVVILVLPLAWAFVQALLPPTDPDGIAYHLVAPKRWLIDGRLSYLPTYIQTNSPMGVELLFAIPLAVWSDTAAKSVHFLLGMLTLTAIFALGRRMRGESVGIAAAALFALGIPFLPSTSALIMFSWAYVDLGVALMLTCTGLALILWSRSRARVWLACAALCAGFAGSFKMTGIAVAAVAGAIVVAFGVGSKRGPRTILADMGIFAGLALLPIAPWLAKSWIQTGNPFWPAFSSVFPTRDWSASAGLHLDQVFALTQWGGSLLGGWSLEDRQMLLDVVMLAFAALAAFALWSWREREGRILTALAAGITLVTIWKTGLYFRFFIPVLPAIYLCIAAAAHIDKRAPARAGLAAVFVVSAVLFLRPSVSSLGESLALATGRADRAAYLTRALPTNSLLALTNARLRPTDRVLAMGSFAPYYSDPFLYYVTGFNTTPLRTESLDLFLSDLAKERIEYVMISGDTVDSTDSRWRYARVISQTYGKPELTDGKNTLYRLVNLPR